MHSPEGTKVTQGSAPGKSAAASNPTTDGPADDMYGVRGDNGHPASTLGGDAGDASTAHASGVPSVLCYAACCGVLLYHVLNKL